MALDPVQSAKGLFSGGLSTLGSNAWILWTAFGIMAFLFVGWIISLFVQKKKQWTHTLRVRRVINNQGDLSPAFYYKMRRFPLIKRAEVFELEKPLLGGYLFPELDRYSGNNEYSIILDNNNRVYTDMGEKFIPDSGYVNVSARHSEIDISLSELKSDWQEINKVQKRMDLTTIVKYALLFVAIIAVTIIAIQGLNKWAETQDARAQEAQAMQNAFQNLADAMETSQSTVNTMNLVTIKLLEDLYGTRNIQAEIKSLNRQYNVTT